MKFVKSFIVTAFMASLTGLTVAIPIRSNLARFETWKATHGVKYTTNDAQNDAIKHFNKNDAHINSHNLKGLSYLLGHNKFSDKSSEMLKIYLGSEDEDPTDFKYHEDDSQTDPSSINNDNFIGNGLKHRRLLASSIDWVKMGAVTPVKSQDPCPTCWAFSVIGGLEGALAISNGLRNAPTILSEQTLTHCFAKEPCVSASYRNAYNWSTYHPVDTLESYPLAPKATNGCESKNEGYLLGSHKSVSFFRSAPHNDFYLLDAVNRGPTSVALAILLDENGLSFGDFWLYKSGIMTSTSSCGDTINHAMLIVAYDAISWTIKNSWGAGWGEDGYIRVPRNQNFCRMNERATLGSSDPDLQLPNTLQIGQVAMINDEKMRVFTREECENVLGGNWHALGVCSKLLGGMFKENN